MKQLLLTALFAICALSISYADCTVTTDCQTTTYEGNVTASISNGAVTITQEGQIIDSYNCPGSGVSVSCSSSSGDQGGNDGDDDPIPTFDICDYIPDFLKGYFGCN